MLDITSDPELYSEATRSIFRGETLSQVEENSIRFGLIMCYSKCKVPTRHKFVGLRKVLTNRTTEAGYYEHIFECECGCRRVWGTEEA
jgi:hypothetical protein